MWSAAAYWHSITCEHPYTDGNKRTGTLAMMEFLRKNGWVLTEEQEAIKRYCLHLANLGPRASVANIARWVWSHSRWKGT